MVTLLPPTVVSPGEIRMGSGIWRYDPSVCTLTQQSAPVRAGTLHMPDFTLKDGVRTFTPEAECPPQSSRSVRPYPRRKNCGGGVFVSRKPPAKQVVPEKLLSVNKPAAALTLLRKGSWCRR